MISRWKASFIHLSLSAIIGVAVLALMLLLWYAPPFFSAVAGYHVLLILLGVDISLGPLITLIIVTPNKSRKALTFDFSIIALLQISALIYGMNVMFQARPVFVVYSKNSFDLVTANMLSKEDIAKAKNPNYQSLPFTGPIYVYSEMPTDAEEKNKVIMGMFSGKDFPQFPQYYQPYEDHMSKVAQNAKLITELRKINPNRTAEIDSMVRATGQSEENLRFLPLRAKHEDIAIVIQQDGQVISTLHMPPW